MTYLVERVPVLAQGIEPLDRVTPQPKASNFHQHRQWLKTDRFQYKKLHHSPVEKHKKFFKYEILHSTFKSFKKYPKTK